MRVLLAAAGFIAIAAQSKPLEFEVASIKPAAADACGFSIMFQPGGALRASNATLKQLISVAYDVRGFQIAGAPSWVGSERFDILAKPGTGETPGPEFEKRFKERIRSLLADRFQLVVRNETKEMPVYALVIAKGGSKLKSSEGDDANRGIHMDRGVINGTQTQVEFLARSLANQVGKPVVDKTGLAGKYDWKLEWTPDPEQL
ncbi:MAG: TIGR03435 family protein, partial [Acidobacteriota bacterium]|nr:TIGR03435 family protein [Acidobacteriota bacterium]